MSFAPRVALQEKRISNFEIFAKRLTAEYMQTLTLAETETELQALTEMITHYENLHEKIYDENPEVLEHAYHENNRYEVGAKIYGAIKLRLAAKKEVLLNEADAGAETTQFFAHGQSSSKLPAVRLPTFSGDYKKWSEFRDLFTPLIINSEQLTGAQRMSYLKTQLKDDALTLICNMPMTDDSFPVAWDLLVKRYSNSRRLLGNYLEELLATSPVPSHASESLDSVLLANQKALNAIRSMKVPVGDWDPILVHVTIRRLAPELREEWETTLGLAEEWPTYEKLYNFLKSKVRAWENSAIGPKSQLATEKSKSPAAKQSYSKSTRTPPPRHRSPSTISQSQRFTNAPVYYTPAEKTSEPGMCPLCKEKHYVLFCKQYKEAPLERRISLVKAHRLCWNCLGRHRVVDCRTKQMCRTCGLKHHTTLHIVTPAGASQREVVTPEAPADDADYSLQNTVLLATAAAIAYSHIGEPVKIRMLIDQGSTLSLITNSLQKRLGLGLQRSEFALRAVSNTPLEKPLGSTTIQLNSLYGNHSLTVQAQVMSKLSVNIPSFTMMDQKWPHLQGLELADPQFLQSRPIDMLLGAAPAAHIINPQLRKGQKHSPIAQSTLFGWIVYGSVNTSTEGPQVHTLHVTADTQLQDLIAKFWEQEEPQFEGRTRFSMDDQQCEDHFRSTHYRRSTGRYVVRLPVKEHDTRLGNSLRSAQFSLRRLMNRLHADPIYSDLYHKFLEEYEQMGHMQAISLEDLPDSHYFLPHHGVLKEQSTTTKLRVVFNGSCNTSTGISLNSILHVGPKVQTDICDVLLRIRSHPILFGTDITKMFRQIDVDSQDWPLQCILWKKNDYELAAFSLTTVTYGTTSAPFLAVRSLLQLAEDEGSNFPLAVAPMIKSRYVDDIYGGADTEEEAIEIAKQTEGLCAAGCFPLAKWASNSPRLLAIMSPGDIKADSTREIGDESVKVLGLSWNPHQDVFQFNYTLPEDSPTTKRTILSEIARLYDPLGFLAPVVIRAKAFMQDLWLEKLAWDDRLSPSQIHKWTLFREELKQLTRLQIPRWNRLQGNSSVELHGFSDASQLAMAAAVYLKATRSEGHSTVTLLCSKTQVAPLKPLTIPRLELNAAVILAQLTRHVRTTMELSNCPTYLWTDSAVTLAWMKSHPSRWKTYVSNRVAKIQDTLPDSRWNYISGKQNPADGASRGLSVPKLIDHSLWWSGPEWLSHSSEHWPSFETPTQNISQLEEKPGLILATFSADSHPLNSLLERFSSLPKLLRVLGICLRAIAKFKKVPQSELATPLSTGDLDTAKNLLIKFTQGQYYSQELKLIVNGNLLQRSHPLTRLTPFVDSHGILRVGGRLKNSLLSSQQKNPAILPRSSTLTTLMIADSHQRTLHGGTQDTLAELRRSVWIIGGRVPVRSYILRCVICARHRGARAQQLMGQLPHPRVAPSRAFQHTGLDYAGPVTLKTFQGRGAKTYKGWIAVFVCFSTSAIHIEVVTEYTTDSFIAAYRRFAARRGICETLYSDCGTNFIGANTTLKKEFAAGSKSAGQLAALLARDGTNWRFNPPGAPHFGGKWEAAVKSIKFHLNKTIGDHLLTYEQLATVLTQIEAVLNSRPLAPLTEDPADLEALTPGHFLIGQPLTAVPEPSLPPLELNPLSKYKLRQQMVQQFWRRWSNEVLHRYQGISKWHHPSNNIQVGTMVLITDERFPPTKWPLARVIAVSPGNDQKIRVVTLRTATTQLVRPISKLCVLPITESATSVDDQLVNAGENVQ